MTQFSRELLYTLRVFGFKLSRYILRETLWLYLLGVAALCLLLSIDFLSLWASFLIEQDASLGKVGQLMLYRLPWMLHLSLPIAIIFAVLLATGRLAKDSELKAIYAAGIAPMHLLGPLLVFGLIVSLLTVSNNGYLEPIAERAYERVRDSFYYTRPPAEEQSNMSYFIEDIGVYYASRIRADTENRKIAELRGVLIMTNDGATITASTGTWDSDTQQWILDDAELSTDTGAPEKLEESLILPFDVPDEAASSLANAETLTLTELWQRLEVLRQTGGDTQTALFNFHRRLADAFSAFIFMLIAGTLGLHLRGRAAGFGWTIVLIVVFWSLWTLSGNFFDRGVLSPIIAAWFTTFVVGLFGLLLAVLRLR